MALITRPSVCVCVCVCVCASPCVRCACLCNRVCTLPPRVYREVSGTSEPRLGERAGPPVEEGIWALGTCTHTCAETCIHVHTQSCREGGEAPK